VPAQVAPYDLVLRNAHIVDGTGSPSYRGDVAVKGDTITAIAPTIDGPAIRIINLGGQCSRQVSSMCTTTHGYGGGFSSIQTPTILCGKA
jgi:predicted amidohydrolase